MWRQNGRVVTADEVRATALSLPRAYEALVRDRVKFRVGRIVFLTLARDERTMGIGFPKEERPAALANEPDKFLPPARADERYNWIVVSLAAIDADELRELVTDAWAMCVSRKAREEHFASLGLRP